jgi:hypothetical protein
MGIQSANFAKVVVEPLQAVVKAAFTVGGFTTSTINIDPRKVGTLQSLRVIPTSPFTLSDRVQGGSLTSGVETETAYTLSLDYNKIAKPTIEGGWEQVLADPAYATARLLESAKLASREFDGVVFGKMLTATTGFDILDAGDFGGSGGAALTVTKDNVRTVLNTIAGYFLSRSLDLQKCWVVLPATPAMLAAYNEGTIGSRSDIGDQVARISGWDSRFAGMNIGFSAQIPQDVSYNNYIVAYCGDSTTAAFGTMNGYVKFVTDDLNYVEGMRINAIFEAGAVVVRNANGLGVQVV